MNNAHEEMKAALENGSLHWSLEAQARVTMWALASIAESLNQIAKNTKRTWVSNEVEISRAEEL